MAVCAVIMHKIAFQADNRWPERIRVQIWTVAVVFETRRSEGIVQADGVVALVAEDVEIIEREVEIDCGDKLSVVERVD